MPKNDHKFFGNLGDIHSRNTDPTDPHWDIKLQSTAALRPGSKPIVDIPQPVRVNPELARLIEGYLEPRYKELLKGFIREQRRSFFFTKNPIWREPSVTSEPIDQFTAAAGVALGTSSPFTTIVTFTVPDRMIGIVDKFGNALEMASAFPDIEWRFTKGTPPGDTPFRVGITGWDSFDIELGPLNNPTRLASQIILNPGERFNVMARNLSAVTAHTAFARVLGWLHPLSIRTADGSYGEYLVL